MNDRLSIKQAAAYAGVSASMVYQWTTVERRLPHYRLGGSGKRGRIVIELADLDAFLLALKVEHSVSVPTSSGSVAAPFCELDRDRLARAWKRD
jgi:excisionase family DNA binding protein